MSRHDATGHDALFDYDAPPPVSLHDRFGQPPFSLLDRRGGTWGERKRQWLSLGIRSELGRDGGLIYDLEATGMGQGFVPIVQRTEQALLAMLNSPSPDWRRKAQEELDRRERLGRKVGSHGSTPDESVQKAMTGRDRGGAFSSAEHTAHARRQLTSAPPPGGGGQGAWLGRKADGSMAYQDSKWDNEATARAALNGAGAHKDQDKLNAITGQETLSGTSVFDPVLTELAYRWFTAPGHAVLDPFAGGSVRGIVAAMLERRYLGIDLRVAQVLANREQGQEIVRQYGGGGPDYRQWMPKWVAGDSAQVLQTAPAHSMDFVFSCPPYADLEVYSDDPADISGMEYPEFCRMHAEIIRLSCETLKDNRFAAWVISDVRDKRTGCYRGLVHETVRAFEAAGLKFYNEAIVMDPVGSAAVRSGRIFLGGRKLTRMHQVMLVFVKGSWKKATAELGDDLRLAGAAPVEDTGR